MYVCEIEDFERDVAIIDDEIKNVYVNNNDDYVIVVKTYEGVNQVWRYNKGCTEGILVSECTDSGLIDIINRLNTESEV